jgi:hypothetical protein
MNKISVLLAFLALAFAELVFASAVVTSVNGNVTVQAGAGPSRPLRLGDGVQQGDTVATGANSAVVLKFDDGQVAALTANSRMTVSTYRYDAGARTGNVLLSLINGGMRTITGLIGRNSPQNVSMRAATATIGIRGTDVTIATDGKNVIVTVAEGAISFSFGGKSITIPAGQAASILNGTMSAADVASKVTGMATGDLQSALQGISAGALSQAINMANTGPVSGQDQGPVQSGTSTITYGTPGASSGGGSGSGSPNRP